MRSSAVKFREKIAVIRKRSGTVVGWADLVDCIGPLTRDEMIANLDRHQGTRDRVERGEFDKWPYAWVLRDVVKLAQPVRYNHPLGAVKWVTLEASVSSQLRT